MPSFVYHVTPAENLPSITASGLQPRIGERSAKLGEPKPAVYLMASWEALDDALGNWLGSEFDEDTKLALLAIDTIGLPMRVNPGAAFETTCEQVIPPSAIKVLTEDLDSVPKLDSLRPDKPKNSKRLPITIERRYKDSYVAKAGKRMVGSATAWEDSNGDFVIMETAVHPDYRRRGINTAMYRAIEQEAGRPLKPAISLSDDAFEFWKKFRPEAVALDLRHWKKQLLGAHVVLPSGKSGVIISASGGGSMVQLDQPTENGSQTFLPRRDLNAALKAAGNPTISALEPSPSTASTAPAADVPAAPSPILVLVHPGSAGGSANFHLGRDEARGARDCLAHELRHWRGGVIVLDGDLSDDLPSYPVFASAIDAALARARTDGHVAIRTMASDPDQMRVIKELVQQLGEPAIQAAFTVTGAWYHPEKRYCVGSVIDALREIGCTADACESAVCLEQEDAEEELDDPESEPSSVRSSSPGF